MAKSVVLTLGCVFFVLQGVLALVEGLQRNRGLLVLDLEYKSIASGEGLRKLLKAHPTLAVSCHGWIDGAGWMLYIFFI